MNKAAEKPKKSPWQEDPVSTPYLVILLSAIAACALIFSFGNALLFVVKGTLNGLIFYGLIWGMLLTVHFFSLSNFYWIASRRKIRLNRIHVRSVMQGMQQVDLPSLGISFYVIFFLSILAMLISALSVAAPTHNYNTKDAAVVDMMLFISIGINLALVILNGFLYGFYVMRVRAKYLKFKQW